MQTTMGSVTTVGNSIAKRRPQSNTARDSFRSVQSEAQLVRLTESHRSINGFAGPRGVQRDARAPEPVEVVERSLCEPRS
jgi:hypothetical protein